MTDECEVPDSDHIARYCKPTTLNENNDEPTGQAFILKPNEPSLSVNWLEYLDGSNRTNALKQLWEVFAKKFNRISTNAILAVLNIGEIVAYVHDEYSRLLSVIHEPENCDLSHCGIHNLPPPTHEEAMLIGELIAERYLELHRKTP